MSPRPNGRARALALVLALAPLLPALGCDRLLVPDPAAGTPADIFDAVWNDLDRNYAFFDANGIDWSALRASYRPLAERAGDEARLAPILGAMLVRLQDTHVTLYTPYGTFYDTTAAARPGSFEPFLVGGYVRTARSPTGHIESGLAAAGVGYVRIRTFEDSDWSGEIDAVLRGLAGVRGLVLDVRQNGGGSDGNAADIAGRFLSGERVVRYFRIRNGPAHGDFTPYLAERIGPRGGVHFAGHVVLLTDRQTFSAAESFVLYMRAAPDLVVVGDSTGGASGRPVARELANGWTYRFSNWMQFTPQKVSYERIGLAPDSLVRPQPRDLDRGIDRVLATGILIAGRP